MELSGSVGMVDLWCRRNLDTALEGQPMGTYRQVVYDCVHLRSQNLDSASNAVKLTLQQYLLETDITKVGMWQPNAAAPSNKSKRFAYYYAVSHLLKWTQQRGVLEPWEGEGSEENEGGFFAQLP